MIGSTYVDSVEKCNPNTKQWSGVLSMISTRHALGAAVTDEIIYAVGGYDGLNFLNSVEKYDPGTNQ